MTQRLTLRHGDCVEVLKGYEDGSIGAVISDPPYLIEFMGKTWDSVARTSPYQPRSDEGYGNKGILPHYGRGGTPQDRVNFKKKANHKGMEFHAAWLTEAYRVLRPGGVVKAFSGTRTFHRMAAAMAEAGFVDLRVVSWSYGSGFPKSANIGKKLAQYEAAQASDPFWLESNTDVAKGSERVRTWGTALKPSWEPVVVGRKPE